MTDNLIKVSAEISKYLEGCVGCIEATLCEQQYVWERNARSINYKWNSTMGGYLVTVGEIDERPICISIMTIRINGDKYLFYHATSELVDHKIVRRWLNLNMPTTAFDNNDPRDRLNHTDATNWVNVLVNRDKIEHGRWRAN